MKKFCELKWKAFELGNIMDISACRYTGKSNSKSGLVPYVGATSRNNGVLTFLDVDKECILKGNCIVFICNGDGSIGYSVYRETDFVGSVDVKIGRSPNLNRYTGMFISTACCMNRPRYSFGYKRTIPRIKKESVLLPATSDGDPDYAYMEEYMRSVEKELLDKYSQYIANRKMGGVDDVKDEFKYLKWSAFELISLFEIKSTSSSIDKKNLNGINGEIPYVTRSGSDNGIASFVSNQENYDTDHGNVITIGLDTQTVNYQPTSFYTGQNIQVLSSKYINRYTALFIIPLIKNQMKKFNWGGNGATLGRLKKLQLLLPAKSDGTPDYGFMEKYMKRQESKLLGLYAANKLKEYQYEEDSRML